MRTAAGFTTRPDSHSFSAHSFQGTFHGINSPWATAIFQPFYTSPRNVFAFQPGLWIRGRVFKGGWWILIPASSRKKRSFSSFPIESTLLRARYSLNGWLNCVKIRLKNDYRFLEGKIFDDRWEKYSFSLNMILKDTWILYYIDVEKEKKNNKNYIQEKFSKMLLFLVKKDRNSLITNIIK